LVEAGEFRFLTTVSAKSDTLARGSSAPFSAAEMRRLLGSEEIHTVPGSGDDEFKGDGGG
jgi:hypothetical protein